MARLFQYVTVSLIILGCSTPGISQFELKEAFPNLSFTRPVDLQHAGDGTDRIFVVEQQGNIYVFPNDSNATEKTLFLDIKESVDDSGNEMGLLGLAFHPNYEENGYFYVDYTTSDPGRRSVISRFSVSENDINKADASSELELLSVGQPESNHNGGQIAFGPEGYLYIALGDGGGAGDDHGQIGNGQNRQTLLGSILRIDVDNQEGALNYAVPDDNPFTGNDEGWREEIYAYGLRNPWRFSFDPATDRLWTGDVGQYDYEEVDIIESGGNYGWRIMEGNHCYDPPENCDTTGLELPVWEYDHSVGQSITGGYVYRGPTIPELEGKYIYADYVQGKIWSLQYNGSGEPSNELLNDTGLSISSFGTDQANELYICTFDGDDSRIYRFKPTDPAGLGRESTKTPADFALHQNYPNPFNSGTTIPFSLKNSARVKLNVYDITGKRLQTLIDEWKNAGVHKVQWQEGQYGSGVYFYRLILGNTIADTKSMLLLK